MNVHRSIHQTLELSAPFLTAVIVLAVATVSVGLVLSYMRRFPAAGRHLILSIAVLAPVATLILAATGAAARLQSWIAAPPAVFALEPSAVEPGIAAAVPVATAPTELVCIVALVWLAAFTAFIGRIATEWLRWTAVARLATPVSDPVVLKSFRSAAGDAPVKLGVSPAAAEPMVIGFLRPVVVLPDRYTNGFSGSELAAVFEHELEHIRRRDNVFAAVHEIVCALFWFSPPHWLARRRLLHLRERACDEKVLDRGCSVDSYLRALARTSHAAIESPAIACMSGFHIRERMESIMSYASNRARLVSPKWIRMTSIAASLLIVGGFALLAPLPSLAAPGAPVQTFEVQLRPGPEGRTLAEVSVADGNGATVMDARGAVAPGQPVRLSSTYGSLTYQVEITVETSGRGHATLEVIDGGTVVHRMSRVLVAPADKVVADVRPISLELKDAELHDVLKTFSQLTGLRIEADASLSGRITAEIKDVPWFVALRQVLGPLGLTFERKGDGIRVFRPAASQRGPDGYLRLGEDITPPRVLARVEPIYPPEAKAARVSGIVILETRVDESGVVRNVRVLKPLPFGLSEAAAHAVRQWAFAPATRDGQPVPVVFNLTVNFRSDEAPAAAPPQ